MGSEWELQVVRFDVKCVGKGDEKRGGLSVVYVDFWGSGWLLQGPRGVCPTYVRRKNLFPPRYCVIAIGYFD